MTPYYESEGVVIYAGDARAVLASLPSQSVQTCVTSPPYWGLRQYLFDGALVVRHDLNDEQRATLEAELKRRNIRPRQSG